MPARCTIASGAPIVSMPESAPITSPKSVQSQAAVRTGPCRPARRSSPVTPCPARRSAETASRPILPRLPVTMTRMPLSYASPVTETRPLNGATMLNPTTGWGT